MHMLIIYFQGALDGNDVLEGLVLAAVSKGLTKEGCAVSRRKLSASQNLKIMKAHISLDTSSLKQYKNQIGFACHNKRRYINKTGWEFSLCTTPSTPYLCTLSDSVINDFVYCTSTTDYMSQLWGMNIFEHA